MSDIFLSIALGLVLCLPVFGILLAMLERYWEHKETIYRIHYGDKKGEPETKSPEMFYYTEIKPTNQSHSSKNYSTKGAKQS